MSIAEKVPSEAQIPEIVTQPDQISADITKKIQNLETTVKDYESKLNAAKGDIEQTLNKEVKSLQKEYIAILGIFSSVVLTFTAGIVFTGSVLENIHKASIYRLSITILIIGFILLNALHVMFSHIEYLIRRNAEDLKSQNTNTKDSNPKGAVKRRIISVPIINGILFLLMLAVCVAWRLGYVESRNYDVLNRNPSETVSESTPETTNDSTFTSINEDFTIP